MYSVSKYCGDEVIDRKKSVKKKQIFFLILIVGFTHILTYFVFRNLWEQDQNVLFRYQGKMMHYSDLGEGHYPQLYEIEKERLQKIHEIVDRYLYTKYIDRLMEEKGETGVADLFKTIRKPTAKDIQTWHQNNPGMVGGMPLNKIMRTQIKKLLHVQNEQKRYAEIVADLKQKGQFKFFLPSLSKPFFHINTLGYPKKGADDALIKLVVFTNPTCGFCKEFKKNIEKLLKKNKIKNNIQIIMMDFISNSRSLSQKIVETGYCIAAQNKETYWKYLQIIYQKEEYELRHALRKIVRNLKMDQKRFDRCIYSDQARKKIQQSLLEGRRLGVKGTPGVFVNGMKLGDENLEEVIQKILDRKKTLKIK